MKRYISLFTVVLCSLFIAGQLRAMNDASATVPPQSNFKELIKSNIWLEDEPWNDFDELLCRILEANGDPNVLNEHGETPLMRAAYSGHTTALKVLLANGANALLKGNRGNTAADYADSQQTRWLIQSAQQEQLHHKNNNGSFLVQQTCRHSLVKSDESKTSVVSPMPRARTVGSAALLRASSVISPDSVAFRNAFQSPDSDLASSTELMPLVPLTGLPNDTNTRSRRSSSAESLSADENI